MDSEEFELKRNHDIEELRDQYTWRLMEHCKGGGADEMKAHKEDFFMERSMFIATVNSYYTDGERVVPSEISIIEFSIEHGFIDQRSFILALPPNLAPPPHCEDDAVRNEERTALRLDRRGSRLAEAVCEDLCEVWDQIKEFTSFDGNEQKLFVCAAHWNQVVGSFQTLYNLVGETAFSRVETRFLTIEDYLCAMMVILSGEREVSSEMKLAVADQMRVRWPGAIEFRRVTCWFHFQFRFENECHTRACAMFSAHEAVFNFFKLCERYVFKSFPFTGSHFPNMDQLPQLPDSAVECERSSSATGGSHGSFATAEVAASVVELLESRRPLSGQGSDGLRLDAHSDENLIHFDDETHDASEAIAMHTEGRAGNGPLDDDSEMWDTEDRAVKTYSQMAEPKGRVSGEAITAVKSFARYEEHVDDADCHQLANRIPEVTREPFVMVEHQGDRRTDDSADRRGNYTVDRRGDYSVDRRGNDSVDRRGNYSVDRRGDYTADRRGNFSAGGDGNPRHSPDLLLLDLGTDGRSSTQQEPDDRPQRAVRFDHFPQNALASDRPLSDDSSTGRKDSGNGRNDLGNGRNDSSNGRNRTPPSMSAVFEQVCTGNDGRPPSRRSYEGGDRAWQVANSGYRTNRQTFASGGATATRRADDYVRYERNERPPEMRRPHSVAFGGEYHLARAPYSEPNMYGDRRWVRGQDGSTPSFDRSSNRGESGGRAFYDGNARLYTPPMNGRMNSSGNNGYGNQNGDVGRRAMSSTAGYMPGAVTTQAKFAGGSQQGTVASDYGASMDGNARGAMMGVDNARGYEHQSGLDTVAAGNPRERPQSSNTANSSDERSMHPSSSAGVLTRAANALPFADSRSANNTLVPTTNPVQRNANVVETTVNPPPGYCLMVAS